MKKKRILKITVLCITVCAVLALVFGVVKANNFMQKERVFILEWSEGLHFNTYEGFADGSKHGIALGAKLQRYDKDSVGKYKIKKAKNAIMEKATDVGMINPQFDNEEVVISTDGEKFLRMTVRFEEEGTINHRAWCIIYTNI